MAKVKLKTVQCITPDEIDKDETYLKYNGEKIWPSETNYVRLDTGDKVEIGLVVEMAEGWNEIELWDFDYMSRNDFLGKFRFLIDQEIGQYSTTMTLEEKESTASYILTWAIV